MKNLNLIGRVLAAAIVSVAIVSCDGVRYPHTENHVSYRFGSAEFSNGCTIEAGYRYKPFLSFAHEPEPEVEIDIEREELRIKASGLKRIGQIEGFYPGYLYFYVKFPKAIDKLSPGDEFRLTTSSASVALKNLGIRTTDENINIVKKSSTVVDGKVKVIDIDTKTVQGITSIVYFNLAFDFVISSEITFEDRASGETKTEQKEFHLTEGRISSMLNRW